MLQSEDAANEFISFVPDSISGLPQSASIGDTLSFQVSGALTIAGVTQPVSFDVTASLENADRLVGEASTTLNRSDFGLTIPNVPFVANVGEAVTLRINFVANAANVA